MGGCLIYLDSPVFVSTMVLRLLCLKMKVDELLLNLDNNRVSGVLLVDYCKAFDMVDHNLLLLKLEAYGFTNRAYNWLASHPDVLRGSSHVRGAGTRDEPLRSSAWEANNWCRSYLSARRHPVCINGKESSSACVNHGVPQRSILGPLFFISFIKDLPPYITAQGRGSINHPPPPFPFPLYHGGGMTLRVRPRVLCAFSSQYIALRLR